MYSIEYGYGFFLNGGCYNGFILFVKCFWNIKLFIWRIDFFFVIELIKFYVVLYKIIRMVMNYILLDVR